MKINFISSELSIFNDEIKRKIMEEISKKVQGLEEKEKIKEVAVLETDEFGDYKWTLNFFDESGHEIKNLYVKINISNILFACSNFEKVEIEV